MNAEHGLVHQMVETGDQKGAEEIEVFDLRRASFVTDYFIVMTALSGPHARALVDAFEEDYGGARHVERDRKEEWVVLDYGEIVVHIFQEEARKYYSLERLWGDVQVPVNTGRRMKPAVPTRVIRLVTKVKDAKKRKKIKPSTPRKPGRSVKPLPRKKAGKTSPRKETSPKRRKG